MCGLFGYISANPTEKNWKILSRLGMASMERGVDATGVAFWNAEKEKYWVGKHHVDAKEFWKNILIKEKDRVTASPLCIAHTRKWTTGPPGNNENNHPLFSESFIIIHNGTCVGTPKVDQYHYRGKSDTELLLAQIERHGWDGLKNCDGVAAIAAVPRRSKVRELYLYREVAPLWLAYNKNDPTIYFGSTDSITRLGCSTLLGFFCEYLVQELPEGELWKVWITERGTLKMEKEKSIEYGADCEYVFPRNTGKTTYYYCKYCQSSFTSLDLKNRHEAMWCEKRPGAKTPSDTSRAPTATLPIDWARFWNVEKKHWQDFDKFAWKYDPQAEIFTHQDIRIVRWYDRKEGRCLVASPEWALKNTTMKLMPAVFKKN